MRCRWLALVVATAALLSPVVVVSGASLGHQQIGSSTSRSLDSSADASFVTSSIVLITSSIDQHDRLACVGAAVAPRYVVTTGDCLQSLRIGKRFTELLVHTSTHSGTVTVPVIDDAIANGVAIVWLGHAFPAEQATAGVFMGSAHDSSIPLNVPTVRERSLSMEPAQLLPLSMCEDSVTTMFQVKASRQQSGWMCIDAEPFGGTCNGRNVSESGQNALLVGYDKATEREVLLGLAWAKTTQCSTESAGSPTSTAVMTFSPFRTFIDFYIKGLTWIHNEGSRKSAPPSNLYPIDPGFGGGSSSMMIGSTGGSAGADDRHNDSTLAPPQMIPDWVLSLPTQAVWLSSTTEVSLEHGTIGWLITARHLVMSRSWFKGDVISLKWATTTHGSQLLIVRIKSEVDFYAGDNSSMKADLLVLELQSNVPDYVIKQLVSVGPTIGTKYGQVTAQLFQNLPGFTSLSASRSSSSSSFRGGVFSVSDDTGSMEHELQPTYQLSLDVNFFECESDQGTADGTLCVDVSVPSGEKLSTEVSVVLENEFLVGLSSSGGPDASSFTMQSLSAPTHRKFLDWATNGSVDWLSTDVLSDDAQRMASYPSYIGQLYSADASSGFESCECVLVSSYYVLTTASCMSAYGSFSTVTFTKADREVIPYNVSNFQVPHPLYSTSEDFTNDIAIIRLETPVEGISPVALNPGYPEWIMDVTIETPDPIVIYRVAFSKKESKTLEACYGTAKKRRGICVPSASVGREFLPHRSNPLIVKTKQGVITAMGLATSQDIVADNVDNDTRSTDGEDGDSDGYYDLDPDLGDDAAFESTTNDVKMYMSFAENANFINGYIPDVTWGKQIKSKVAPIEPPSYVVGLRIDREGPSFCSGTLIASSYVMTAAHCVDDALAKYVIIGAGTINEEILPVMLSDLRVHPSYGSPHQFSYDAAIFELRMPASSYGIRLDTAMDFDHKTRATMFGFGSQKASIHSVDLPLYSREQCMATLPNIDDSMLCAGGEDGRDACQGDSGGPLVLTRDGTARLVGIVSAGYGCGIAGVPGIYARVSSLAEFINSYVVGKRWDDTDGGISPSFDGSGRPATRAPGKTTAPSSQSDNGTRSSVDAGDIESYSRDKNTTAPTTHTQVPVAGQGVFDLAIKETVLPDTMNPRVRVALLAFLMSDYKSFLEQPRNPLQAYVNPTNAISFWNQDGTAGQVVNVLNRHSESPLYTRKDRFGRGLRAAALWEEPSALASKQACQSG